MSIKILKNYINGKWVDSKSNKYVDNMNPSTGEIINKVPLSDPNESREAVLAAKSAFKTWSKVPISIRCNYLFKLRELIEKNDEKITKLICEESGKSISDANAELKRTRQNIEVSCGLPNIMKGEKLVEVAPDIDTESIKMPIGPFAIIAPFNFPAMVPFWFLPYAIASGNTIVLKPSEQAPNTQTFILELLDSIKIPAGVVNLVNGDRMIAEALIADSNIKGVSFVGSTNIAKKVLSECGKYGKRSLCMGGAKNYLVVMPDANLEKVVDNMITSCFGCAGQRCMAASMIACVGEDTYKKTKKAFIAATEKMVVGNPLDPRYKDTDMLMGPVISASSKERMLQMIELAKKEGYKILLDNSKINIKGYENGYFVGPVIIGDVKAGSIIERTEIFGPVVGMMKVDSLDEVLQYLDDSPYGNGASIYTQNGFSARKFEVEAQCGMIGINLGVPAPVAYFPFGGMKDSFMSDIKAQSARVIDFYTDEKIITRRFFKD